jgi:hypothetical protein
MQRGCMQRNSRKEGPDVWQFRWSETRLDGKRLYHKKILGTVEQYPDEDAARRSVVGLVSELNTDGRPTPTASNSAFASRCIRSASSIATVRSVHPVGAFRYGPETYKDR